MTTAGLIPARWPWNGTWADPLFGVPLRIVAIVVAGVVARYLAHRLIDRIVRGIAAGTAGLARFEDRVSVTRIVAAPLLMERREQRARTTASVLQSLATAVISTVVLLTVMDVLSIPVAPLLASAGIVGVAVGFGAQSLVKDVISGLFMIVEDQYGVVAADELVEAGRGRGVLGLHPSIVNPMVNRGGCQRVSGSGGRTVSGRGSGPGRCRPHRTAA